MLWRNYGLGHTSRLQNMKPPVKKMWGEKKAESYRGSLRNKLGFFDHILSVWWLKKGSRYGSYTHTRKGGMWEKRKVTSYRGGLNNKYTSWASDYTVLVWLKKRTCWPQWPNDQTNPQEEDLCEKNEWQHHTQLKNTMDSLIKRHTWDMTQEGHVLGRHNTGLMRPSHEKGITC